MEKRLLLAFVLSAVIFALWSVLFPPQRPPSPTAPVPVESQPASVGPEPTTAAPSVAPPADAPIEPIQSATEHAVVAASEQTVQLANDDMVVEFTNRGAAISSFQLIGFTGDEGEPLDLIQSVDHAARSLPLQLVDHGGPDQRLYVVDHAGSSVTMRWADGLGSEVTKTVVLPEMGYGLEVQIELMGGLQDALISTGTGLRDLGEVERNNRLARWGDAVILADNEYQVLRRAKVKQPEVVHPQILNYGGFQDTYFLLLLRPTTRTQEVHINRLEHVMPGDDEEPEAQGVLEVLLRPAGGVLRGQLLGAPKEYTLLQEIGGGVERTLDFGFFGPISVLFLKALWWIYGLVGNYGVAIILLTVGIRLLLFPLMHTSTVSMRKMQKLQPKVKEIQAKHKKKKMDQQARAKMNQEMMALYKQEGVNPMGGCLPLLVQLPILWALYKLFLNAIELRHAPFMLWIQDLSAKDPYYVTPILMTATMWLQQRLAPQAGDPQQQRMMRMLPLVFGIMFLQFPSGLVLYWLTNNVLTIFQQEVTLHLVGERKRGLGKGRKK
jgi:YidC/Oxa1 family membrane protein insertase